MGCLKMAITTTWKGGFYPVDKQPKQFFKDFKSFDFMNI